MSLPMGPSMIILSTACPHVRVEVSIIIMSLSLLLFSGYSFCCLPWRNSISPQFFFRNNYSICRYRLCVSMGGGEFRVFLHSHLGPPSPQSGFLTNVTAISSLTPMPFTLNRTFPLFTFLSLTFLQPHFVWVFFPIMIYALFSDMIFLALVHRLLKSELNFHNKWFLNKWINAWQIW